MARCWPAWPGATHIRCNLLNGLRKLYDVVGDEAIRARALELIERLPDPKYRKKYAAP